MSNGFTESLTSCIKNIEFIKGTIGIAANESKVKEESIDNLYNALQNNKIELVAELIRKTPDLINYRYPVIKFIIIAERNSIVYSLQIRTRENSRELTRSGCKL